MHKLQEGAVRRMASSTGITMRVADSIGIGGIQQGFDLVSPGRRCGKELLEFIEPARILSTGQVLRYCQEDGKKQRRYGEAVRSLDKEFRRIHDHFS